MNTESLRTLAANLKESSEALYQQIRETEGRDLEETYQWEKFPSLFRWEFDVPWRGVARPMGDPIYWYLKGTPAKPVGHKLWNCYLSGSSEVRGLVKEALGNLFGIKAVYGNLVELGIGMSPEELLKFLQREDVHYTLGTLDKSIEELRERQEALVDKSIEELRERQKALDNESRLLSEYFVCLETKRK